MKIASVSIGIALNRAFINTFRPLMAEILFKGLITLKLLNPDKLNFPPEESYSSGSPEPVSATAVEAPTVSKPDITITKSSIFQGFFMYESLPKTKPSPRIFNTISEEYRQRNILSSKPKIYEGFVSSGSYIIITILLNKITAIDKLSNGFDAIIACATKFN